MPYFKFRGVCYTVYRFMEFCRGVVELGARRVTSCSRIKFGASCGMAGVTAPTSCMVTVRFLSETLLG